MYKTTGFRDWQEANDTIKLLRKILGNPDTDSDQRIQARGLLADILKPNPDDCIRCGMHFLEMEVHHTLSLSQQGKVLTFCSICMSHVEAGIHPIGAVSVVQYDPSKRCSHCNREVVLDDRVPLDKSEEFLCFGCNDKLLEELDDFTINN